MQTELTYKQKYYQENKHKWREWAENNRERKNETSRKSAKKRASQRFINNCNWIEKNYEKSIINQAKRTARYKGIEFNISVEDIVIPEICPYLGCKLTRTQGHGRVMTNASIDRIDNSKGYVKGNIRIISLMANLMKRDATQEQLVAFANGILALEGRAVP